MSDQAANGELKLSAHELQSPLAGKLRKYVEARLQQLRTKNDGDLDAIGTAKVRGEIKDLKNFKNLLALGKQKSANNDADAIEVED